MRCPFVAHISTNRCVHAAIFIAATGCASISGINDYENVADHTGGSGGNGGIGAGAGGAMGGAGPTVCRALMFDGVDDRVTVPAAMALNQFGPITIEAWVNATSYPNEVQILSHHDHDANSGYVVLIFSNSDMQFRYQFGGTNHSVGGSSVSEGGWHHIAATYDNDAMRAYVDGELINENTIGSGSADPYGGPLRIGAAAYSNNFYFHGLIDDVRLSRGALYAGQSFTPPQTPLEMRADTVGLWRFDNEASQTADDATGNHDGMLGDSLAVEGSDPVSQVVPCTK